MLRTIFVLVVLAVGAGVALRRPFYALPLYLWVAYFRPDAWLWDDFVTRLNLSFVAGAYVVLVTPFAGGRFRLDVRSGLLVLLVGHATLSAFLSPHPAAAWSNLDDFAKAALMAGILATLVTDRSRLRVVLAVIALSLGLEAAKQGWIGLLVYSGQRNENAIPFLGDNNGVGLGMLMLVPIVVALSRTASGTWERCLYRAVAAGVLFRGITTYSRGAFVASGALLLVYLLHSPRRLRAALAVAAVAAVLVATLPAGFWNRMSTIAVAENERDLSNTGRLHFWHTAMAMVDDRPLVGVGPGAYNASYDDYDVSHGLYGKSRSVHSVWFGVLAELGWIGLGLFVSILLAAAIVCARVRRVAARRRDMSDVYHYAVALQASLAVFAIGGSFLAWQYGEMLWHVIGLTIALHRIAVGVAAAPAAVTAARPPAVAVAAYRWPQRAQGWG